MFKPASQRRTDLRPSRRFPPVRLLPLCAALLASGQVFAAAPTVSINGTSVNVSNVTLTVQSSEAGKGYLTLLSGAGTACGTGTQVKSGESGTGAALRFGSLSMSAGTATYTISNLSAGTTYTACFTADDTVNVQATPATVDLTTPALPAEGGSWSAVGGAGISTGNVSYTSLAFAPDGTPYVAYRDDANSQKVTVMKFSSGAWNPVGSVGFSAGSAGDISLAFAPDGTPYVAYGDGGNGSKATVMKFSGGAWGAVGSAGFSAGGADSISLAFAPDGTPHVAYKDSANGLKLTVMKFDLGTWSALGSAGFSPDWANMTSLAFGPDGVPYVAYQDYANSSKATVMKYSGGSWSAVGSAGFSAGASTYRALVFAPDGTPYLAYTDVSVGNKATLMKFSGGNWSAVGAVGFSAGSTSTLSLSFSADGTPYVAYYDGGNDGKATVMKYSGGAWSAVGGAGFSADSAMSTSLAFAPDGIPYLAYRDGGAAGKATVMKLGPGVPATPVVTATGGNQSATLSFATPANGGSALIGYTVALTPTGGATTTLDISGVSVGSTTNTSGGPSATVTSVSGGNTVITVSGLSNGTTYAVTVSASNGSGAGSASTSPVGGVEPMVPPTVAVSANVGFATLTMQSPKTGKGYFTLLPGTGTTCGSATQIKNGQDSGGGAAFRYGSLPLTADTAAVYTVRNLLESTAYTVCFSADDGTTLLSRTATVNLNTSAMAVPGTAWSVVGGVAVSAGEVNGPKLAFAPDGTAYLAYVDIANGYKASVKKFSGGVWSAVGSTAFSSGQIGDISLVFAPDGTPYVRFRDYGNGGKATVMKYGAGSWSVVGSAGFSAGDAMSGSMAIASDGTIYVAYSDRSNSYKATVMKYSAGAWSVVGSASFSPGGTDYTSLAIAPDGTPYIAFKNNSNAKVMVMKFSGGSWNEVGSGEGVSAGTVFSPSLAFSPDGTPHLAYRDDANGIKVTVLKYSGGAWSAVGSPGFSTERINLVEFSFAPDGSPYVAFLDNSNGDKATVMKYSGGTWRLAGKAGFSAGAALVSSLSFAPDGTPYVAYQENTGDRKAVVMKMGIGVPDAPTDVVATAGTGSASVAFTAPLENGGTEILEYTASCAPANTFSSINWTASASGTASPITVSGLTGGMDYKCSVKAKNNQGYGDYSSPSASVKPTAVATTPVASSSGSSAPQMTSLPSGGGTAAPSGGQTVVVTNNGANGSSITLPPGDADAGAIKVALPGGNTINVNKDTTTLIEARVSVTQVILPGSSKPATTLALENGKANFTATQSGQPVAGLLNGIVVVSGSSTSQVTLDTTGSAARIGVSAADTIVVPSGTPNVSGTVVDLPRPGLNGEMTPVTVKAGDSTVTVQATQADTRMTFQVIDIGGVKTPVLAVSGTAQVGASGDNQPLVSVNGNVITSGSSSGGQQCNTVIQASSTASQDVVQVVTCYVVLPVGSFSSLGNRFAAIKDGIVWAGETAEFDKNGNVTGAYLGTKTGTGNEVGDDMTPGGNKFAANYSSNAFIPRLAGKPMRLNGEDFDESLFRIFGAALGTSTVPLVPTQNEQGILSFVVNRDAASSQKAQSLLGFALTDEQVNFIPTRRVRIDTSRADGVALSSEGCVEVVTGGLVTTFAPSVGNPQAFAEELNRLFPGSIVQQRWNGSWQVSRADGATFVGRPTWNRRALSSAAGFVDLQNGTVEYRDGSYSQTLVADFYDYTTLQSTITKELGDSQLKLTPRMDGTVSATVNGATYTLTPQWQILSPSMVATRSAWWIEQGLVYLKNADGSAQGFAVK